MYLLSIVVADIIVIFLLLLYVRRSPELPPPKVARSPAAVSRELSNHSHVYLAVSQRTRNRPRNSHIKSSSWTRNERAREKEERKNNWNIPATPKRGAQKKVDEGASAWKHKICVFSSFLLICFSPPVHSQGHWAIESRALKRLNSVIKSDDQNSW